MTKRLVLLSVIVLAAVPVLAGCASNNTTPPTTTTSGTPTTGASALKIFGSEGLYNSASDKGLPTKAGCSSGTPPCASGKWLASGVKGTNPSSGNLTVFATKFKAANGHDPAQYSAESYDGVMYIALAALKAQSVAGKDIKEKMLDIANPPGLKCNTFATCSAAILAGQDVDYAGMAHDFDFDQNHEPKVGIYDVWQVQDDGTTKTIATGKTVSGGDSNSTAPTGTPAAGTPITPQTLELKLGLMMPLSGALGTLGPDMQKGAELAIKEVNDATATTSLKITSFAEDDKTSDKAAITGTFDKLVGQGVTAIVGPCCSGVTGAILDKAVQNGVVIASPSATSPALTLDRTNNGYFWRVSPSDAVQGKVLADIVKADGVKSVTIIYVNNPYGSGLNKVFTQAFGADSVKTAQAYNEQNSGDFASQVTSVCGSSKADALIIFGYIDDGANILKEMQKQGCIAK